MNVQTEILEAGTPPRPTLTADMRADAVRKMMETEAHVFGGADQTEALVETLARRFRGDEDGYELGRSIERDGWHVDARVVEALDELAVSAERILTGAVRHWVQAFDIRPPLSVGTRVTWKQFGRQVSGEILDTDCSHCYLRALYLIREDGRIYPGGGSGSLVAYELCTVESTTASEGPR